MSSTKVYNIPEFLDYINIQGTPSDTIQVIHYNQHPKILMKSSPVEIDFYLLALKDDIDVQPPIAEMSDSYMFLDKPGNAIEWELNRPFSGYAIFINKKLLGKSAKDYSFTNYDRHEALYLTSDEKGILYDLFIKSHNEYKKEGFSMDILVSYAALILSYTKLYYERQFESRSKVYNQIVASFYQELEAYFQEGKDFVQLPSVTHFAEKANLSTNYFGDLIKHFTGNSPSEHIHQYIIQLAKNKLRHTKLSVSEIAYGLGFEYPTYFTRFFKKETGITPTVFRNQ